MLHSGERILTTHAGSLPRPQRLTELYAARAEGAAIDEAELAREADAAVRAVITQQIDAGIDIGNNGEQPREAFFLYVQRRMSGFGGQGTRSLWRDGLAYPDFLEARNQALQGKAAVSNMAPPKVIDEIRYLDRARIEAECDQFRDALKVRPNAFSETFITAPSPGIIAAAVPNRHYDSFERYLDALSEALAIEYHTIVDKGFLLQLDCPDLALERHVSFADRPLAEFIRFIEQVVDAINRALRGIPRERVRLHVCWGNYEGPHDHDVPLSEILTPILAARVGGFLFPLANPRHAHEHRCFQGNILDDDQLLIAGVIDTTTNYIEHPQVVADRIVLAAQALGDPQRVIAATDCGFDTSAGMGRVAPSVVWAKLRALRDGARLAGEQLF
jgi:5-methyltetrahydropteroyltriglutamate--homocysteine methyltransferase